MTTPTNPTLQLTAELLNNWVEEVQINGSPLTREQLLQRMASYLGATTSPY